MRVSGGQGGRGVGRNRVRQRTVISDESRATAIKPHSCLWNDNKGRRTKSTTHHQQIRCVLHNPGRMRVFMLFLFFVIM